MRFAAKSGESRFLPIPAGAENFPYWEVRPQVSPPLLRGDPVANKRSCANFPPSNRSCGILSKNIARRHAKKRPRTKPDTISGHPDGPRPRIGPFPTSGKCRLFIILYFLGEFAILFAFFRCALNVFLQNPPKIHQAYINIQTRNEKHFSLQSLQKCSFSQKNKIRALLR